MSINTINKELHLDNFPYEQPDGSYRDSRNGVIIKVDGNNYTWSNQKGTLLSFSLGSGDPVLSWCWIRDRLFIITLNEYEDWVKILEILFDNDGIGIVKTRYVGSNGLLNFSFDNPIRKMIGFYENDEIQRIYLTDNSNQPRVLNIGSSELIDTITGKEKFLNFYPIITTPYGKISLVSMYGGGYLYAGSYFICWQYYTKDGYYSDWSPLSSPISITGDIPSGYSFDNYQNYQGKNYTENTFKSIEIKLEDLDHEYDRIRIAAFYSNDYNSVESGIIFYDGEVSNSMEVVYTGSENAGSVTVNEVANTSVLIERCKNIAIIRNMMVMSNVKERTELDVTYANTASKNDRMDCEISKLEYNIISDYSKAPSGSWGPGLKALQNSIKGYSHNNYFYPGIWHKNTGSSDIVYKTSDEVVHTIPSGWFFKPSEWISGYHAVNGPIFTTEYASPYIVLLRYRKADAELPVDEIANQGIHINEGWVFDAYPLFNEWLDYKSSFISHYLKGYPQGERVRLGIVFFDETGRPFFTRWLRNTDVNYSINGDTQIPLRNQSNNRLYTTIDGDNDYKIMLGHIFGLRIKNIDITNIKDRVKGMMIVRAPIVRKYEGSGVIINTQYKSGDKNNIYPLNRFIGIGEKTYDPYTYAFYCPEDVFELSGFSVQPGDNLVNSMYLRARNPDYNYAMHYPGFGYIERDGLNPGFIHKFYDDATVTGVSNGAINAKHEVLFNTKFRTGDEDELICDPRNILKKYKNRIYEFIRPDGRNYRTSSTDHAILVLDINHGTSDTDIKGIHSLASDNSHALVCLVEKPIDNTYGGISEASLAGTRYISTGHFQKIDNNVLTDIENNGRYVFNDIDIFGGDTFINMFDYCRGLADEDNPDIVYRYNTSFIVPLESRINIALRGDNHVARNRSYINPDNLTGLRRSNDLQRWEDYNYNDAYSSSNIDAYFLALPFNFSEQDVFDTRHRYSNVKSYGELRDSFRIYGALNYLDVESLYGPVINTASINNYLVYWQPDMIGYIPVSEKATQAGELGQPIQIGIGGVFERYDSIVKQVGNSNQFGLVESPGGFHWYDAKRKLFIHLPLSMQLSYESITKGVDSFFSNIPSFAYQYDNPIKDYGMFGGYDPKNKIIFYTFIMPNNYRETIAINIKSGNLVGFFDYPNRLYISHKNMLFGVHEDRVNIYKHDSGVDNLLYGQAKDAYISIVIKADDLQEKIFDSFVLIGNNKFFDEINYVNSSQEINEIILSNRNYLYRNNRWYGNFPKVNRQRFVDGYIIVTYKVTDTLKTVKLNKVISQLTNMY